MKRAQRSSRGFAHHSIHCNLLRGDEGQVSIFVVLVVSLFLMGFVGFGVDMTNLFLHRQMAQGAADAACVAAGMDMIKQRVNGRCTTAAGTAYPCGNFTIPASADTGSFNCSSTPGAAPCTYAAKNGYSGASGSIPAAGVESNFVQVSFPSSVPGVPTPDAAIAGPTPFVKVDVYEGVRVYFSTLLSGHKTEAVHAIAKCGLQVYKQPIPILVLDPTEAKSFQVGGNPNITILGGPSRSIQVNSDASSANASGDAAYLGGTGGKTGCVNGQVNLCQAGINFDGADFGVTGGPPPTPAGFATQSPFGWRSGVAPVADPFQDLPAPPDPVVLGTTSPAAYLVNGCPDTAGCVEYTPGDYPNGIVVSGQTAIFDTGVYYVSCNGNCAGASPGFYLHSGGVARSSSKGASGGDDGGAIFYLTCSKPGSCTSKNEATINVSANSGVCATCDAFSTSRAHCPGDTAWDSRAGIPATVTGNVLLAPCTTLGTYPGAVMAGIGTDTAGPSRGILFFADHSAGVQEFMSGQGGLLLTGTMYFRDCPNLLTTGACSAPPTDYQTAFTLDGGSGSGTRVFGEIVTDQLALQGTSGITMDLNPWARPILKVALMQ